MDLDESVVLTHLRTELISEETNISPDKAAENPWSPSGPGRTAELPDRGTLVGIDRRAQRAVRHEPDRRRPDLVRTAAGALAQDEQIQAAAQGNDLGQFSVFVGPMDRLIYERHGANDELLKACFDKPEFKGTQEPNRHPEPVRQTARGLTHE